MASRISTVLIIGATSGIGEAFARRFHNLGKQVIATGRNQDKLNAMAKKLPGLQTRQLDIHFHLYQYAAAVYLDATLGGLSITPDCFPLPFDISDLPALPGKVDDLLKDFPSLDTVIITTGIQFHFTVLDLSSITTNEINDEITTNLTAPTLLIRLFVPHLMQLASTNIKTTLFVTSSALAYIPLSFYPTYCATKAGIQALVKVLRQQLAFVPTAKDFRVVEIVPPYTDTRLDKAHREATITIQGGPEKAFPAMPLDEFVEKFFQSLEQPGPDGEIKKEIGVGFGEMGSTLWRDSFGKVYENMNIAT